MEDHTGNIRQARWSPREGGYYLPLLIALLSITHLLLRVLALTFGEVGLGAATVIQIMTFNALGFGYSNFVTTRRPNPMLGNDGALTDLGIVCLATPIVSLYALVIPRLNLYGSMAGGVAFLVGFVAGLHFCYLARPDSLLAGSFKVGEKFGVGHSLKLLFILINLAAHLVWCASNDAMYRPQMYLGAWGVILAITFALRKSHHLHLHHWFLGLVLLPACIVELPGPLGGYSEVYSLALVGFSLSQFVEGASRWSCANIWVRIPVKPPVLSFTSPLGSPGPGSTSSRSPNSPSSFSSSFSSPGGGALHRSGSSGSFRI
jgi:hypothetical protein